MWFWVERAERFVDRQLKKLLAMAFEEQSGAVALPPLYKRDSALLGMTQLNKDAFDQKLSYPCISVPHNHISRLSKNLKHILIKLPKFKSIYQAENDFKTFVLDPIKVSKCCSIHG